MIFYKDVIFKKSSIDNVLIIYYRFRQYAEGKTKF